MKTIEIYVTHKSGDPKLSGWARIAGDDYHIDDDGYVSSFKFGTETYVLSRHVNNPVQFARNIFDSARSTNSSRSFLGALAPVAIAWGFLSNEKNRAAKQMSNIGLAIGSAELLADVYELIKRNNKPEGYYNSNANLIYTAPIRVNTPYFKYV